MHIHPASQIKASNHSKTVLELTKLRVNRNLVEHIVHETIDTVNKAIESPSSSRGRCKTRHPKANDFAEFAANVIGRAEVPIAVLLVTLVYINRSRPHLSVEAEEWALHRVFLGALILASKFTNDSTLQNVHWAIATGIFGKRDVGRIEREFLEVLDWDLTVSESEIANLYPSIIALYPRAQQSTPPPIRPARCPTFTFDPISYDSDDSSSSAGSSPRTPCDSEKTTQFVKFEPSTRDDFHRTRKSSHSQSQWFQNQALIAALADECCPVLAM
ncbi:hypothetical protein BJ322DRAFT_1042985 [Thelephora terrestris]|uniref:Cyclin N-terminal domain-containing protein n=1 Tax=Thelephora terrestris TaxID=56493 RepID=A0A9P6L9M3_9AGAM|nr:hypothetical protein BJ322DRAFT_1042985 [Thelephora terrestris]